MRKKKGFLLIEFSPVADLKELVNHIKKNLLDTKNDYVCTVVGKYNIVVEREIEKIEEIDTLVTSIRNDDILNRVIRKTTTFLGIHKQCLQG